MNKNEINGLIDRWVTQANITPEQAHALKADVVEVASEKSGDRFITAVMYMGAIALSLGALLFIASNWEGMSKATRLVLSLLLPVIPLGYAYWKFEVQQKKDVLARAANILGVALIGGTLAMIGQIYNLEVDTLSFLTWWTVLSAPFIFVFRLKDNVVFTSIMTAIVMLYATVEWIEESSLSDSMAIITFTIACLVYAALFYGIGALLRHMHSWRESGRFLRITSAAAVIITLFITTFEEYAREVTNSSYSSNDWQVASFGFNLFFILFLLYALFRATKLQEYNFAFTIVRVFGFYLIVKYFTLFYDMLDTSIIFISAGLLFIAGGWTMERHKDRLIQYMKDVHKDEIATKDSYE